MVYEFVTSFLLGLATPLTALCVIPLYPGFIAYLSKQLKDDTDRKTYALFGFIVVLGVITFMLVLGLVFTTIIQASLTNVIEYISPLAFILLGVISLAMIFDINFQKYIGFDESNIPEFSNPLFNGFSFGFFFGAILIPCNPAFIATFFARAFLFETPFTSLMNFLFFGLGIGFPLMVFTLISSRKSSEILKILQKHEKLVYKGSGILMLSISLYYLINVFKIIPGI